MSVTVEQWEALRPAQSTNALSRSASTKLDMPSTDQRCAISDASMRRSPS